MPTKTDKKDLDMNGIEQLSDRDLLIRNTVSLESLCISLDKFEKRNSKAHLEIFKELRTKVPYIVFIFIVGSLITGVVALTSYMGGIKTDVVTNTAHIERLK